MSCIGYLMSTYNITVLCWQSNCIGKKSCTVGGFQMAMYCNSVGGPTVLATPWVSRNLNFFFWGGEFCGSWTTKFFGQLRLGIDIYACCQSLMMFLFFVAMVTACVALIRCFFFDRVADCGRCWLSVLLVLQGIFRQNKAGICRHSRGEQGRSEERGAYVSASAAVSAATGTRLPETAGSRR